MAMKCADKRGKDCRTGKKRTNQELLQHYLNLEELHEMEELIPMTLPERDRVRKWVYNGHSVSENPWKYRDGDGYEMNYLDAYHRHLELKWGKFYRPFYQVVPTDCVYKYHSGNEEAGDEWAFSE